MPENVVIFRLMTKKKLVKIELISPRYTRAELRDHASEFALYARYAGYVLDDFNIHLAESKLHPLKPDIAERNHKLVIETTLDNARILYQITQIYPSFSSWRIKALSSNIELASLSLGKAGKKTPKKKKPAKKLKAKPKSKSKARRKAKSKVKKKAKTKKKPVAKKTKKLKKKKTARKSK